MLESFIYFCGRCRYQLKRYGDGKTLDVHAISSGGVANAAVHEKFCAEPHPPPPPPTPYPKGWPGKGYPARADCVVQKIYDQSGNGNHLLISTPAINNPAYNNPVNATRHPISMKGRKVFGAYFETGMGYRAQNTSKVATGNEPETIYMVTSGTHLNAGCCCELRNVFLLHYWLFAHDADAARYKRFDTIAVDYGNSENDCTNHSAYCDGCMEAVYMGTGYGGGGKPWIGVDMENGIYGGAASNDTFLHSEFVTAMGKGGISSFATKGGNASAGGLTKLHDGPRPKGYQPMHKTGAIILGVGGDNIANRRTNSGDLKVDRAQTGSGIPGMSIGTFYGKCGHINSSGQRDANITAASTVLAYPLVLLLSFAVCAIRPDRRGDDSGLFNGHSRCSCAG